MPEEFEKSDTEDAFPQKELHYRHLLESISEVVYEINHQGLILFVSPSVEKISGYLPEEVVGKPFSDFLGIDGSVMKERLGELLQKGEIVSEYLVVFKHGKERWVRFSTKAVIHDGTFMGGTGIMIDITEKKEAELALQESEEKYRLLAENIMDVIWVLNLQQNRFTYISPSVFQLRGYSVEEALEQNPGESLSQESAERVATLLVPRLDEFLANPTEKMHYYDELQQTCKDGSLIWIETLTRFRFAVKGEVEVIGVSRNIEKRKLTEQLLKESEDNFRAIANYTAGWEALFGPSGKLVWMNPYVEVLTGYTVEECLAAADFLEMMVAPEDLSMVRSEFGRALQGSRGTGLEFRVIRKDEALIWISVSWQPMFNAEGRMTGFRTSAKDITERKKSQKALAESEAFHRSILQASPDVIAITSLPEGYIRTVSPKAFEVFGILETDDYKKYTFFDFLEEKEYSKAISMMGKMFDGPLGSVEYKARKADGTLFDIEVNGDLIRDSNGEPVGQVIIVRDITERKKVECALRASEVALKEMNAAKDKLFSIIAHDLRAPVGSFAQGLEMITEMKNLDVELRESILKELQKSAKSTFSLLENLLNWARIQSGSIKTTPQDFILNHMIWDNIEIISLPATQKNIRLSVKAGEVYHVFADKDSVNLVFRNLLSNAVKFTPEGGAVTIAVCASDGKVEVEIADTGVGMGPEILRGLFRPDYFTTFGTNGEKGSGIGLILVKDFIGRNGGTIAVDSEPGKGSRFSFTLPAGSSKIPMPGPAYPAV